MAPWTRSDDRGTGEHPVDGDYLPIRVVAGRTGVAPMSLRAWERRYQLLQPVRSPLGHRLYSHADVARIRDIARLLAAGVDINEVRSALDAQACADRQELRE